jgi:DNA-binding CsgD family transcriptional regulator
MQGDQRGAIVLVDEALDVLAPTDEVPARAHMLALGLRAAADLAERARARRDPAGIAEAADAAGRYGGGLRAAGEGRLVEGGATDGRVASRVAWGIAEDGRRTGSASPDSWAEASTTLAATGETYLAAYARYREAEAVLDSKSDRARAETILRVVETWAGRVGAEPLLRDVRLLARRARLDLSCPSAALAIAPATCRAGVPTAPYGLSPRECDVLALLVEGRTNREIGEALFISEKTASSHVTHILDKLGVSSRGAAAALAVRGSLLEHPWTEPAAAG